MTAGNEKGRPAGGVPISSSVLNLDDGHGTPVQRQSHEHTQEGRQTGHLQQVRGCLVVVVETPGEKYRRRTSLTLAAAERACRRAKEAGYVASITVARLEPVAVIQ